MGGVGAGDRPLELFRFLTNLDNKIYFFLKNYNSSILHYSDTMFAIYLFWGFVGFILGGLGYFMVRGCDYFFVKLLCRGFLWKVISCMVYILYIL
jgi:hypothetical protein